MIAYKKSEEKKTKEKTGYVLGQFFNYTNLNIPQDSIWYSYDKDNYNFHIVPDHALEIQTERDGKKLLQCWLKDRLADIRTFVNKEFNPIVSPISSEYAKNHRYIKAKYNGMEYLLLSSRLWHKNNIVNNNFGQIQFICYPMEYDEKGENIAQINKINGGFFLMYPDSDKDGVYNFDINSCHLTYNPIGLTIMSDANIVAQAFNDFINKTSKIITNV